MKTLSSPRRMQSMPRGRPILYKEGQGTSARGHFQCHPSEPGASPHAHVCCRRSAERRCCLMSQERPIPLTPAMEKAVNELKGTISARFP